MITPPEQRLQIGHLKDSYGLQGWLWVHSLTDPLPNLFDYAPWYLNQRDQWRQVTVKRWKAQGKGYVVKLDGFDDATAADTLRGATIWMDRSDLPAPAADEYYWSQLTGLQVFGRDEQQAAVLLGVVHELFETGANDVMVVRPCAGSVDQEERWIPWHAPLILQVDLAAQRIDVDWQPDY